MENEVVNLSTVNMSNVSLVGGKNASLGEMISKLSKLEVQVPPGFAITTIGFSSFLRYNQLNTRIQESIQQIDYDDLSSLQRTGEYIRSMIRDGDFPPNLRHEIINNYEQLQDGKLIPCAVRSSSTAEDLQDASFAGQQETYLNVRGIDDILVAIKDCFASLYTDRAISYRHTIKYEGELSISVGVQVMVESYCSGVAFSIDPDSGFRNVIVINASWGLGELIVQGGVNPDEFIVFKPTSSIIDKKLGVKTEQIIYSSDPKQRIIKVPVNTDQQSQFCLNDTEVLKLANWVSIIEQHYQRPVDIEWAMNSDHQLYIVQARPETIHSNRNNTREVIQYQIEKNEQTVCLISGIAVGDKISSGHVRILSDINGEFNPGDILVTDITDPDWEPIMMKAGGIITNRGGRTCHAAIIAREMGLNAIVGTNNCTEILQNGQLVTISCCEGDVGFVYEGQIRYSETRIDLSSLPKLRTKVMFNIASPNDVFRYASYPAQGVGLVREEFIINNYIQVHPSALINYDDNTPEIKDRINQLIAGYSSPVEFYVNKLAYGLGRIASTFYPNDVIVRFSDFKSNEYRNLLGGDKYEPHEENPMIGWRGCSRYYSEQFKQAFGLECLAIKKVREEMGLKNVIVMLPFCRTVEECLKVQEVMAEYGLKRGVNDLQVYIMCEIPSNVILADEFCKYVDGFSIGSNDLTQLILGLDRDSHLVAHVYNERNPAVKMMISLAIQACKRNGVKIGICGQGPSDYPDFAQFLVEEGINSISIVPDSVLKTFLAIAEIEQK
jgi:pyruvate,water dikinase